MNRPQLYFETSDILIEAYQNETLFHDTAWTCAIANIIAVKRGCTLVPFQITRYGIMASWEKKNEGVRLNDTNWYEMVEAPTCIHRWILLYKIGWGKYQIQKKNLETTCYSIKELKKIMAAFDFFYDGADVTKNILPALKNVLRTLKDIHRVSDLDRHLSFHAAFDDEESRVASLPTEYEWVKLSTAVFDYTYKQYIADKKKAAETNQSLFVVDSTIDLAQLGTYKIKTIALHNNQPTLIK